VVSIKDKILKEVRNRQVKLIFPEGEDERILQAISYTRKRKIVKPILLGEEKKIKSLAKKLKIPLQGIEIINPSTIDIKKYAKFCSKKTKTPLKTASLIVKKPLFFAATAVAIGDAKGMVAGAVYTSADVITVSKAVIGLKKGLSVPSSYFIMEIPNYKGG